MIRFVSVGRFIQVPAAILLVVSATAVTALSPLAAMTVAAAEALPVNLVHDLKAVRSGRYLVEHDHTRVVWKVSHHGFSHFQAVLPKISGTLQLDSQHIENSRLEVIIDMTAAVSGIAVFDERMADPQWEIFSSRKFPTAIFRSTAVQSRDARRFSVTGELTFLGVTHPITLEAQFNQAGTGRGVPPSYRVGFDATAVMKRGNWGSRSIPTLGNDVQLAIEAEFLLEDSVR